MHVQPKSVSAYPWLIRLFFWKQKRTYGRVLEPGLLWGRSPFVFVTMASLYGAFNRKKSPIDAALRSLVTVRVSQINHCEFCIDINASTLLKRGVTPEKVEILWDWRNSDLFSDLERCALDFTEAMTVTDRGVDSALMEQMKKHFDEDALVEITGLVAFQNMSSKFNSALDVPSQGFCQIPLVGEKAEDSAS